MKFQFKFTFIKCMDQLNKSIAYLARTAEPI